MIQHTQGSKGVPTPGGGVAACRGPRTRKLYLHPDDLRRLERLGRVDLEEHDVTDRGDEVREGSEVEDRFISFAADLDVLLLGRGAPRVSQRVLAAAPRLKLVGEIEGDRFSRLVDVPAATRAGVLIVDTTHASSGPVAEWALALALVGLRQHARFRDIIGGKPMSYDDYWTNPPARELTGKRVGMVGFGHIAWRLRRAHGRRGGALHRRVGAAGADHRSGAGRPRRP